MRVVPILVPILLCAGAPLVAQNCVGQNPAGVLRTREPFQADFFLGSPCNPPCTLPPGYRGAALYFDLATLAPLSITRLSTWLYDEGSAGANPDQTGNRSVVQIYTCPTTWIGYQQVLPGAVGSPWTLAGSGVVTLGRFPFESPIVLSAPIALPVGQFGVAIEIAPTNTTFHAANVNTGALHPLLYTSPELLRSDPFLQIREQAGQSSAFVSATNQWLGNNVAIEYQAASSAAYSASIGVGCYDSPAAFFEVFGGDFDLANSSQHWSFTGRNYDLAASSAVFVLPTGTPITASPPAVQLGSQPWSSALSAPITLPAPFPFPGGPAGGTTTIVIGSNGRLFLEPVVDPNAAWVFHGLVAFAAEPACLAPCYGDFAVTTNAAIHYETDNATWARITWLDVAETQNPTLSRFQVTLRLLSGDVDISYGNVSPGVHAMLFGFTPGNGQRLAPEIDVSAQLPWSSGRGIMPPRLFASAPPNLGTTVNLVTGDLSASTTNVLTAMSLGELPGGLPLALYGLPGCSAYVASFDWLYVLGVGAQSTASVGIALPANPLAIGLPLYAQTVALTPGFNPAGLLLSNGLCLALR